MDFVKIFENLENTVCVCIILSFENHQNQIITKINFPKTTFAKCIQGFHR